MSLADRLEAFRIEYNVTTKGKLSVVLFLSRKARQDGLPLEPSALLTGGSGQVKGLGSAAIQAILADYGITRILAAEAGRTSRGSIGKMMDYVAFMNQLHEEGLDDRDAIEAWWVDRVRDYFDSQPFRLRLDPSVSLNYIVKDLLEQAKRRQRENPGMQYAGAVIQHLVGAKLQILYAGRYPVEHHGFSVADAPTGRAGDFIIGNTSFHVTITPGEALIRKCQANIDAGLRPLIVTVYDKVTAANQLADNLGIQHRVEIFDAEQFIATNVNEWSSFDSANHRHAIEQLITTYNGLIDAHETDPSLKVELN